MVSGNGLGCEEGRRKEEKRSITQRREDAEKRSITLLHACLRQAIGGFCRRYLLRFLRCRTLAACDGSAWGNVVDVTVERLPDAVGDDVHVPAGELFASGGVVFGGIVRVVRGESSA